MSINLKHPIGTLSFSTRLLLACCMRKLYFVLSLSEIFKTARRVFIFCLLAKLFILIIFGLNPYTIFKNYMKHTKIAVP